MFSNMVLKYKSSQRFIKLILMSFVFGLSAIAQESSQKDIYQQKEIISFGESLSKMTMRVTNEFDWKIIEKSSSKTIKTGVGESLKDFVFETPGNYLIELSLNENHKHTACSHGSGRVDIDLTVSNVKMTFDFSKVKFSSPIRKGQNTQNITMTIPVMVNTFDKSPVSCTLQEVATAGIGTNIVAKPVNKEITLNEGIQELSYRLSGIAQNEAYIMFDFIDYNNQIQSFSLLEPIK